MKHYFFYLWVFMMLSVKTTYAQQCSIQYQSDLSASLTSGYKYAHGWRLKNNSTSCYASNYYLVPHHAQISYNGGGSWQSYSGMNFQFKRTFGNDINNVNRSNPFSVSAGNSVSVYIYFNISPSYTARYRIYFDIYDGNGNVLPVPNGWTRIYCEVDYTSISVPSSPTGVSASDGAYCNKVRIAWNGVSGANGYRIYRGSTYLGSTSSTYYDDSNASTSSTQYRVYAYNNAGNSSSYGSNYGYKKSAPSTPSGVNASDGSYTDKVRIAWNSAGGVNEYLVYRGSTYLGSTSSTYYDDSNASTSSTQYRVYAKNSCGNSSSYGSDYGYKGTSITRPPAPTGVSASDGVYCNKVRIAWNGVSGANGYRVYRGSTYVGNTSSAYYDDSNASTSSTQYRVYAYNNAGNSSNYGSNYGYKKSAPSTPSGVNASDGSYTDKVRIAWNSAGGASEYLVYRGSTYLGSTSSTYYDDSNASTSSTQYRVYAKNSCGNSSSYGSDYGYKSGTNTVGKYNADPCEVWRRFGEMNFKLLEDGNASHQLSPAELIYYSAQENQINPVLLLTKLQDEQSLIEQGESYEDFECRLLRATGYGAKDSGDDNTWYGFYPQIVSTTYQFRSWRNSLLSFRQAYEKYTTGAGKYKNFIENLYPKYAGKMNQISAKSYLQKPDDAGYFEDFRDISITDIQNFLNSYSGALKNEQLFAGNASGNITNCNSAVTLYANLKASFSITPSQLKTGEDATISVTIQNTGSNTWTGCLALYWYRKDGGYAILNPDYKQSYTIDPGRSITVARPKGEIISGAGEYKLCAKYASNCQGKYYDIASEKIMVISEVNHRFIGDDYPLAYKSAGKCCLDQCSADFWNFYKRECTSFVAWRMNRDSGHTTLSGNAPFHNNITSPRLSHAKYWATKLKEAGYRVNKIPLSGAIAQWSLGEYGHVGYVGEVYDDGRVLIEEYNWASSCSSMGKYSSRVISSNEVSWFIHFNKNTSLPSYNLLALNVTSNDQNKRTKQGGDIRVAHAKVSQLVNNKWATRGYTDQSGNLFATFYPAIKAGDKIKVVAAGFKAQEIHIDDLMVKSGQISLSMEPSPAESDNIINPSVEVLDGAVFYQKNKIQLKITAKNHTGYQIFDYYSANKTVLKNYAPADSLIQLPLKEDMNNYIGVRFLGKNGVVEIVKSVYHTSQDEQNTYKVNVVLNNPTTEGINMYINGKLIKKLNSTETIELPLGINQFLFTKEGYINYFINVDTTSTINLDMKPLKVTGLDHQLKVEALKVFPNPSTGEFLLVPKGVNVIKVEAIRVLDPRGREVYHAKDVTTIDKQGLKVNLENFPSNFYLLGIKVKGVWQFTKIYKL